MAFRLQLSHKLIGLVFIPLAFEYIIVGFLVYMQTQSETEIGQLEHSRAVVSRVNELAGLLYAHVLMLARKGYSLDAEPAANDERELQETMQQLQEITFKNPSEAQEGKKLIDLTNQILLYTKSIEQNGSWAEAKREVELFMLTTKLISETRTFLRQEKEIQTNAALIDPGNVSKNNFIVGLIVLMIVSSLITLAVALFLQKTIARRIGVMRDNTYRLASNLPMHPSVQGTDEIAQLDQVFHQMAATLKEAELERERNEQLKADFVAMVSHDLRTPLTSVQLFISLLGNREVIEQLDIPKRAKKAEIEIGRLIRLINNLLDLEKAEGKVGFEIVIDAVPLSIVLQQSVAAVEDYGKQSGVKIEFPQTDLIVDADQDKIIQVTVNLLSNAIKFSPSGAVVRIDIESQPQWVEISVTDSGRGIPKQFHQAIFDRYKQVTVADDRLKGGTGLGLAICKVIVELHGGKIGVESEPGQGSKFWYKLPQLPLISASQSIT